jgi:hypothetical protein
VLPFVLVLLACGPEDGRAQPRGDEGTEETAETEQTEDTGTGPVSAPEPLPLCINEFMPDNVSAWRDDLGAAPDWIELHNPTDAAVDLSGWTLSDDAAQPDKGRLSGALAPGGFLLLRADDRPGDGHLPFRLSADGGDVALFAPDGRGQVVSYGVVGQDFSVARLTDCCSGDGCLDFSFRGTPGYGNTAPGPPGEAALPEGSFWWVLAWPALPPADWTAPGFDATTWTLLQAPLGYGQDDLVGVIDAGPPEDRVRTLWARASFPLSEVPDSAYLRMRVDDGARVVLNGVEVARVNLPDGELAPDTLASSVVLDEADQAWTHVEVDAGVLVAGDNVLAVQVHQATVTSVDLVLDLGVYVRP